MKPVTEPILLAAANAFDFGGKLLVDIIKNAPYQIPPRYEKLVGNLDGIISRRINIQHRLVYQVYEDEFTEHDIKYQGIIKIIRMWTHYDNVR